MFSWGWRGPRGDPDDIFSFQKFDTIMYGWDFHDKWLNDGGKDYILPTS